MALPRGDQYNEAVQNPKISFADIELNASKVETGMFDLPKPYSGGFTVTFKLQSAVSSYAVRCFTRDIADIQKRYQAITDFFSTKSSRFFVNAKYLANGIKVAGKFYPIIKMKWMDGVPLNMYLENNRNNKVRLQSLLNEFLNLVSELETLGIAHGDLQQGNIIVKDDRLLLIDYDGMFLPSLSSLGSNELGHPNFQHPQRSSNHFNARIDRFSEIVIYISLKGLIAKPTLWKYNNGENIILKSQDIADLSNSPVVAELNSLPELKLLVDRFVGVCHLDFDKIPSLTDFISGNFTYDKNNVGKIAVKSSQYDVLDARLKDNLLEHFGKKVEVIGKITDYHRGSTSIGSPYYFLNFGHYPSQTFTITVWSEGISALTNAGKSPTSLVGKWVSIIGVITNYRGRPQVIVDSGSQIQIINNEQEANDRLKLKKTIAPAKNSSASITANKKIKDKEFEVFDSLYKNIPVSKPQTNTTKPPQTQPVPTIIAKTNAANNNTYSNSNANTKSSANSSGSSNGCFVSIVMASLGGVVGLIAAKDGGGFVFGAIIGALASLFMSKD